MVAKVTEDDTGKTVVASNGDRIGTVVEVRDGTPLVDLDDEVVHDLTSVMEWDDQDQDTFPIQESAIAEVTEDEIRLTDEFASGVD